MEDKLIYLILAGWAAMIFLPSVFPALILAAGMGGAAAYLIFLGNGGEGDLVGVLSVVGPVAAVSIFLAWPVGALFRWVLRRKPSI
jgi:hypothetical protein